jgi:hypothetical protein
MQKLMGRLNNVAQMAPFFRAFKFPLNQCLKELSNGELSVEVKGQARKDLEIWANFLLDEDSWHHIAHVHQAPPLSHLILISDASGKVNDFSGCGSIGLNMDQEIFFAHQLFWTKELFLKTTDSKGAQMSNKTVTLELIGILMPFIVIPKKLCNRYIVVKVDNVGCYYSWINRQATNDAMASILVRALHLISNFLACDVHIEHLPRLSTWQARMVDRMSRKETTTRGDREILVKYGGGETPHCLVRWLKSPGENWGLCLELLEHVKNVINNTE